MFNMRDIGMNIQSLRKNNDMTQMELADKMGVSYQAVSNWERGNSMPDIQKLPELAEIFSCTIDALLGQSKETELTKAVIVGLDDQYILDNHVTVGSMSRILPIMKPEQAEEAVDKVIIINDANLNVQELTGAAPFLKSSYLEKLADKVAEVNGLNEITGLAPFLTRKALDSLVDKYFIKAIEKGERVKVSELISLAPFLSNEALDKIASITAETDGIKELISIAPFLNRHTLDGLVERYVVTALEKQKELRVSDVIALCPFLTRSTADRLAGLIAGHNIYEVTGLAPFLSGEVLAGIVRKCGDNDKFDQCSGLFPFLPSGFLHEIADELVKTKGIYAIKEMLPFL